VPWLLPVVVTDLLQSPVKSPNPLEGAVQALAEEALVEAALDPAEAALEAPDPAEAAPAPAEAAPALAEAAPDPAEAALVVLALVEVPQALVAVVLEVRIQVYLLFLWLTGLSTNELLQVLDQQGVACPVLVAGECLLLVAEVDPACPVLVAGECLLLVAAVLHPRPLDRPSWVAVRPCMTTVPKSPTSSPCVRATSLISSRGVASGGRVSSTARQVYSRPTTWRNAERTSCVSSNCLQTCSPPPFQYSSSEFCCCV